MPTIRVKKDERYFVASNEAFNDERLSWEARGLMGYLLSKPNDWVIRQKDLEQKGPAGDHKLRRMLAELRKCGYMNRIRTSMPDGTFEWETEIYESPSQNPNPNEKVTTRRFSTSGSSTSGETPDIVNTDEPNTDSEEDGETSENVFATYEQEIGPLTPMIAQSLQDDEKEHAAHWVCEAIKIASKRGARNYSYISAILKRWKTDGYGVDRGKKAKPDVDIFEQVLAEMEGS